MGEFAAVITAFCWALTSIIFTDASRSVGSFTVNITRLLFAFLYLTIYVLIVDTDFYLNQTQYILLCTSGLAGLTLGDSPLYLSYKKVGPRIGMLMMTLVPAITTILGYLIFKEKLTTIALSGILCTVIGVNIVILQNNQCNSEKSAKNINWGIIWGLLGEIGQGCGLVLTKAAFLKGDLNSFTANYYRIIAALITILPLSYFIKDYKTPTNLFLNYKKLY